MDEVPDRIVQRVRKAVEEKSKEDVEDKAKRAVKAMEMHALAQWASGKVFGPATTENIEKKIKKTEALIEFLYAKGLDTQKQEEKLTTLKDLLANKRRQNGQ